MLSTAVVDNLLSAPVLAFVVALVATFLKSDIKLPQGLYPVLSTYLLLAIGLKGGKGLAKADPADLWQPLIAAVVLGIVTPLVAYAAMRRLGRIGVIDSAAIAAHYGSVSAVTFTVVLAFLEAGGEPTETFLAGLLAVLEIIGIVVALALAQRSLRDDGDSNWGDALTEVIRGRSIVLLLAGLIIGLVAGPTRLEPVDPLFVGLFPGLLTLFMLDMGTVAAQRIRDVREAGWRLVALAVAIPLVNGFLGAAAGALCGLGIGGTTVLATLAASASYIAAPAAVRIALPTARPGLYITASLGVTFPFNIVVGIPLYYAMAKGLT
ncbi:MAG: sodium-dependent bicarbonate transport family permease [Actinomycetota bacterium]